MADAKGEKSLYEEARTPSQDSGRKSASAPAAAVPYEAVEEIEDPDPGATPEERAALDKKLMRKVDLWLIPYLCLLYLLSFLDRTNIGNARLVGLEDDLGMSGHDYNHTLTIFFISYAVAEPITNVLLKRLSPRIFFTAIMLAWGLCMTLMGLVENFAGLMVCRFFLGLAEAGLFPGVTYYLSCWYKRGELGVRVAGFFSAAALAGSFGGLLAAAIALMDGIGGLDGWAWIFILEGLATMVVGVTCWWMIQDWPATARCLTPAERLRMRRRLAADNQASTSEEFDRRHIIAALKDWKCYGYAFIYMGTLTPLYAFSLFLPTIINGLGYEDTQAQLLSVPPYACAAVLTICVGWFADRTKWRGYCNIGTVCLGIIGFSMLLGSANPDVQYAGTFLGACGIYPAVPNTLTWAANNLEGVYKRGFVLGVVVGWGNLNGVVSSNIFIEGEKPRFYTGHGVILAYLVVCLGGGSVLMHVLLRRENARRRAGLKDAEWDQMTPEQRWVAGDNRPNFQYCL